MPDMMDDDVIPRVYLHMPVDYLGVYLNDISFSLACYEFEDFS